MCLFQNRNGRRFKKSTYPPKWKQQSSGANQTRSKVLSERSVPETNSPKDMSKPESGIVCGLFILLCCPLMVRAQNKYVYSVKIAVCKFMPTSLRSQTGFRVRGIKGIVTALHGVADCNDIRVIG